MSENKRNKLRLHSEAQKRHRLQRIQEVIAEEEYLENVKDPSRITAVTKNAKRFVDEAIPSNAIKWLETYHPDLVQPYIKHVSKRARTLDKVAKFMSDKFGIELHKEHPLSVSGANDIKLSPTTPISDRGPNTEGFSGNARFNRRLNRKNAFSRVDLEQLNIATNWQGSVSDFVANRPDITDQVKRKALNLPDLKAKTSDLGMLKLQQGDLNVDQLEMKQFIEHDLKKSGIALSKNDSKLLGDFISTIESKEQGINAAKHGDNWDLKTKFKHSTADQRLSQRVEMGRNAVKRQNPKFTKLVSEVVENGETGVNGTNGVNGAKKVINMERLLPIATAVSKKVKPVLQFAKPVAKYGIPLAGTVIAASNQKTIAAEYEKNPTTINRARTLNAKMQLNLEALDTATLGATGAVTWIPNLIGDVAEYGLWRTQNPQTKEEFNKELENNGGFHGTL